MTMASIRKRSWKIRGVERTAWIVDYFSQDGRRHIKTFETKKAADAWAVTARHEVAQGVHTPVSRSITVDEALGLWITESEAAGLEQSTIRQRRQHAKLHLIPFIGREKLAALTTPRIYDLDAELRKARRSTAMRRGVLTTLKMCLKFCQGRGLCAQNVALPVRIKNEDRRKAKQLKEGVDFPSKGELKLLIDKAPDRWRPYLLTAVFTGMRASELRGLCWGDVDLDAGVLHVTQRADAWKNIGPPKSAAGVREIPLVPMAINALRQWRLVCPPSQLGLAFPNGAGNVESEQNITKRQWAPLQVTCGIVDDEGDARYNFHRSGTPPPAYSSPRWVGRRSACRPFSVMHRSR
jgi:integrase